MLYIYDRQVRSTIDFIAIRLFDTKGERLLLEDLDDSTGRSDLSVSLPSVLAILQKWGYHETSSLVEIDRMIFG